MKEVNVDCSLLRRDVIRCIEIVGQPRGGGGSEEGEQGSSLAAGYWWNSME